MSTVEHARGNRSALRWIGVVATLVSAVVGGYCAVRVATAVGRPLVDTLQAPTSATPLDELFTLREGRYSVYEVVLGSNPAGVQDTTIRPRQVTVVGPSGEVPVSAPALNETLDRPTEQIVAVAGFTASTPGSYRVTVRTPGTQVVVAPSLGAGFGETPAWLIGAGLSGVGFLVGLGLVIASFVRGRTPPAYRAGYAGAVPATPPGWYADPQAPQQWRYWDGAGWTAHTQPRG